MCYGCRRNGTYYAILSAPGISLAMATHDTDFIHPSSAAPVIVRGSLHLTIEHRAPDPSLEPSLARVCSAGACKLQRPGGRTGTSVSRPFLSLLAPLFELAEPHCACSGGHGLWVALRPNVAGARVVLHARVPHNPDAGPPQVAGGERRAKGARHHTSTPRPQHARHRANDPPRRLSSSYCNSRTPLLVTLSLLLMPSVPCCCHNI